MDERILSDKQRSWLGHVEACVASGGSMKAYADKHALDLQTFYLWKGRLKKLGLVNGLSDPGSFEPVGMQLPVPVAAEVQGKTCIQLANGVSIECPCEFDAAALTALLVAALRLP